MKLNECVLALMMIDGRAWGNDSTKTRLVLAVASNTAGVEGLLIPTTVRDVAKVTGLGDYWVARCFRELLDERVLLLMEEAAGRRGRCYIVNPEPRGWQVPWKVNFEAVEKRLDLVSGRLQYAKAPVAPRHGAALTRFVTDHGAAQNPACAGPWRGANGGVAPDHGAAQRLAGLARAPLSERFESSSWTPEEHDEEKCEPSEGVEAIARVIRDRTTGVLVGRPQDQLTAACEGLTREQCRAVEQHTRELTNPGGFMLLVAAACAKARDLRAGIEPVARANPELERTAELLADQDQRGLPSEDYFDRLRGRVTVGLGRDDGGGNGQG